MNLNILYEPNETGHKLFSHLKKEWPEAIINETEIHEKKYLLFELKSPKATVQRIVNSPRAITNCLNKENMTDILAINRIPCLSSYEDGIVKQYSVLVSDLNIVSMQVKTPGKGKEKTKYIKEFENKKVAEAARRTVHVLGLDIGMVNLVLTSKRRLKVVSVDSSPIVREKDVEVLRDNLRKIYMLKSKMQSIEVKLGADPEFMMFNSKNNRIVSASDFFPREGLVGCDNIRIPNRQQRPVAEIRPKPEFSPLELLENVKQALNSASIMAPYRNVKWLAGSQPIGGYSIGGHIHFSNVEINAGILRALDNYLGLLVFMIEDSAPAVKRRRKYGFLGDYRIKDYGGFEYRTPGSWLVSQNIGAAVLCLAKIVASRYYLLSNNYLNTVEAQKAFYEGNQDYFKEIFITIWSEIKHTDMYSAYKQQLELFPDMINKGANWNEKMDLRTSWKISLNRKNYNNQKASNKTTNTNNPESNSEVNISASSSRNTSSRIRNINTVSSSISVNRSRSTTVNNTRNPRSNNPSSGRIIAPHQVRRSHTVR